MSREELIEYIKKYDHKCNYDEVNINVCSDEELISLKRIVDSEKDDEDKKHKLRKSWTTQ
jgi:hypothetical protein